MKIERLREIGVDIDLREQIESRGREISVSILFSLDTFTLFLVLILFLLDQFTLR